MEPIKDELSRRNFILKTTIAGAGIMLAGPVNLFSNTDHKNLMKNIKSKGYAGHDRTSKLTLWNFERRAVGDNDILIDVKFSGAFHTAVHHTANTSLVAHFKFGYILAHCGYNTGNLVSGYLRIRLIAPMAPDLVNVRVADTRKLNIDQYIIVTNSAALKVP